MEEKIMPNGTKTAEQLAMEQREISISEFFEKNRHLLGFDSKIKALLIIIKEGVDNALDACEEARILPEVYVKIEELEKEKYKIIIKDNGPGIVKKNIAKIFGTLLFGSKFHKLRQSRGQQGLGISMCVLYSQLTSGEPTEVISSTGNGEAHKYRLKIDVKTNSPVILSEEIVQTTDEWHGIQLTFVCEGLYREHKQSVLEYLKETAVSNPFARIIFEAPTGKYEFNRGIEELPKEPTEIQPHLYGVEVGLMSRMLHDSSARTLQSFLTGEFTRVGKTAALDIIKKADIWLTDNAGNKILDDRGNPIPGARISPKKITDEQVRSIIKAVKEVKLTRPPTDCLSPLGEKLVQEGLKKEVSPDFITAITRSPTVYRGWPFQVEVGIAYGGSIEEAKIMRFANRVPLLYQAGDCSVTKAIQTIDWRRYGLEGDKIPVGPIVVFVHICSVWVPFTSESKEAVASYPIILKEVKLALQEATRKLSTYLSGVRRAEYQAERMRIFERYAGETALALNELTGIPSDQIEAKIKEIVSKNVPTIIKEEENGKENREPEAKPETGQEAG